MFEGIIAGFLILLAMFLPIRWAFSLTLATAFSLFYYLISDVSTAMFVILLVRVYLNYGLKGALQDKLFSAHLLLVTLGAFSLLWTSSVWVTMSILIAHFKVLIIAVVSLQIIQHRTDYKYVIYGLMAGLTYILIALIGWRFGLFGVSTAEYSGNIAKYGRLLIQYIFPNRHTPINSNTWAALTSLSTGIITIYFAYFRKTRSFALRWIILGLIALVIVITSDLASRSGLLGLLVALLTIFFFQPPRRFYRGAILVIALFFSGSLTVSAVRSLLPDSEGVIYSRLVESEQEDPRVNIWETGLAMAFDNFMFGVGLGSSGVEFKNYMTANFSTDHLALHNSFLTHFAELGIIGLILFIRLMYLWQRPLIYSKFANTLLIIVSFNILLNAFAHSFEMENNFMAIIYVTYKFFLIEQRTAYVIANDLPVPMQDVPNPDTLLKLRL